MLLQKQGQTFYCQMLSYKQANRDHVHNCDSADLVSNQIQIEKKIARFRSLYAYN